MPIARKLTGLVAGVALAIPVATATAGPSIGFYTDAPNVACWTRSGPLVCYHYDMQTWIKYTRSGALTTQKAPAAVRKPLGRLYEGDRVNLYGFVCVNGRISLVCASPSNGPVLTVRDKRIFVR